LLIEQGCTDIYVKLVEESSFKVRSEKAVKNYRDELEEAAALVDSDE